MHFYYDQSFKADSTSIDEVFYNGNTKELVVKFLNGNLAGYWGVQVGIFNQFRSASSTGQFYNTNVRGWFKGFKVDGVSAKAKPEWRAPEPAVQKPKFKVTAEVTGSVTLDVHADDIADALAKAEEQINKAFGGSVTVNFKGVNLV